MIIGSRNIDEIHHDDVCEGSDTDSSQDSCDGDCVNDSEDDCRTKENITSQMFAMALVPTRTDLSDHSSDDEIYEDSDTESEYQDARTEPSEVVCKCGRCLSAYEESSYCCDEITIAVEMRESKDCITQIKQFIECIENVTVLELTAFSFNKGKSFPQREDNEKFNKLMRYTAYRTFLHILNFRGLGTGRRYRLPACVEYRVRELYPSQEGNYVGLCELDQVNSLQEY